jgi:hypothetical protein
VSKCSHSQLSLRTCSAADTGLLRRSFLNQRLKFWSLR